MRGPRDLPIALVLVAGIGVLVLIATVLVVATGYEVARLNTAELIREKADLVTASIIERTRNHLDPARTQLEYLADLISSGRVDTGDREALGELLVASLAAVPQMSVVAFVDKEVRVLRAFRNRPGQPVNLSDWSEDPSFRRALARDAGSEGAYWGELFVAEEVGLTFINVRMPVRIGGRFAGSLVAGVSIEALSEFLGVLRDDYTYNAFILSEREFVLAHPLLREGFPGLSDDQPLPYLREFGDAVLAKIWSPERRPDIEANLAGPVQVRVVDFAGGTYVFLFRGLDGYGDKPWLAGTYLLLDDAAAQFRRLGLIPRIGLVILGVALVLAFALGRTLSRPVRELAAAATRVRNLDLDGASALERSPFRELNDAAAAFNAMVGGLRWFQTYVPRSLVQRLIREEGDGVMASEEREITVLFTDVAGFTARSETLPAAEVASFLNQHFALVGRCVEAEGGTVDKYIGDSLMAFWGAPERQPDHAERACRAALGIARAIEEDNARRGAEGGAPVFLRIGIHSGPAVVGNIGAPSRINYTIIGDSVNTAERLEELARELAGNGAAVCAVMSGDTARRLGVGFHLTPLGRHRPRGRHDPIEVYRLETSEAGAAPAETGAGAERRALTI